jgi:hypothetical protein
MLTSVDEPMYPSFSTARMILPLDIGAELPQHCCLTYNALSDNGVGSYEKEDQAGVL